MPGRAEQCLGAPAAPRPGLGLRAPRERMAKEPSPCTEGDQWRCLPCPFCFPPTMAPSLGHVPTGNATAGLWHSLVAGPGHCAGSQGMAGRAGDGRGCCWLPVPVLPATLGRRANKPGTPLPSLQLVASAVVAAAKKLLGFPAVPTPSGAGPGLGELAEGLSPPFSWGAVGSRLLLSLKRSDTRAPAWQEPSRKPGSGASHWTRSI